MELREISLMFEAGKLQEAIITPAPTGNGWWVEFKTSDEQLVKLTDHSGEEKQFKDMDLATRTAEALGFKTVRVEESF